MNTLNKFLHLYLDTHLPYRTYNYPLLKLKVVKCFMDSHSHFPRSEWRVTYKKNQDLKPHLIEFTILATIKKMYLKLNNFVLVRNKNGTTIN